MTSSRANLSWNGSWFAGTVRIEGKEIESAIIGTKDVDVANEFVGNLLELERTWPEILAKALPKIRSRLTDKEANILAKTTIVPFTVSVVTDDEAIVEDAYFALDFSLDFLCAEWSERYAEVTGALNGRWIDVEFASNE